MQDEKQIIFTDIKGTFFPMEGCLSILIITATLYKE